MLQNIIDLMHASSKDSTRYHLCGVHIEVTPTETILSVTDGHIAVIETLPETFGLPEFKGILMGEYLPVLKAANKENRFNPLFTVNAARDRLTINQNFTVQLSTEHNYPNINILLNILLSSEPDPCYTVTFDVDLLMRLSKSLGKRNRNGVTLRMGFNVPDPDAEVTTIKQDLKPILVTMTGEKESKYKAVLMPMRG